MAGPGRRRERGGGRGPAGAVTVVVEDEGGSELPIEKSGPDPTFTVVSCLRALKITL